MGHTSLPLLVTLDTIGDGTGSTDGARDFSSQGQNLQCTVPPGKEARIESLTIIVRAMGNLGDEKYGQNITLVNGISVLQILEGQTIDLTSGEPIMINTDWLTFQNISPDPQNTGGSKMIMSITWQFPREGIILKQGEKFAVSLHDDFSSLVTHRFSVSGQIREV